MKIISFFIYLYSLLRLGYSVILVNTLRYRKGLYQLLEQVYGQQQQPVSKKYRKRIYYHGMLGSITNEWFASLRGSGQTTEEATAGFYLGAATAVYDDLFDQYDYTMKESLEDLASGQYKYGNITEILSKQFYDIILANLADQQRFDQYLKKVGYLQEVSKQQVGGELTIPEIRRITYEKGQYSVALSRSILRHPYQPGEAEAIYKLGEVIQFTDDIFDVRRDYLEGVDTLLTTADNIELVRNEYVQLLDEAFAMFGQLEYRKINLYVFFVEIMFIISRGLVALDQLIRAQQVHGGIFRVSELSREELVCDMERPVNIMRSSWYCVKWDYGKYWREGA